MAMVQFSSEGVVFRGIAIVEGFGMVAGERCVTVTHIKPVTPTVVVIGEQSRGAAIVVVLVFGAWRGAILGLGVGT